MNFSFATLIDSFSKLSAIERIAILWKENKWPLLLEWTVIWLAAYAVVRLLHSARGGRAIKVLATPLIFGALFFVLADGYDFDGSQLVKYKELFSRISLIYMNFLGVSLLVMLVVFQPELRRSIVLLSEFRLPNFGRRSRQNIIQTICSSVDYLSKNRIGALIVIERHVSLAPFLESGTTLDAVLSKELLATLFWPGSMLHDMAVVIRGDKIVAAGVQLPLADADLLPQELGSRHRAAVGLSTEVDALIIVVSEETGIVSIAENKTLKRNLTSAELREHLLRSLPSSSWFGKQIEQEPLIETPPTKEKA